MASSIIGTFPILNSTKSQTDEYGFDYITHQYTIKTSTIGIYNIKKDDVFDSIETWRGISWANSPNPGSLYVVESVESLNTEGGLTQLTVNTVGSKNTINPPRVSLISGGPLIFGLSGTAPAGPVYGYGVAEAGQSVEVRFIANGGAGGQQEVFTRYFASSMPITLNGISLPAPTFAGGASLSNTYPSPSTGFTLGQVATYYGFVCKTILTEKRGSLLLVTLVFSEAGLAVSYIGNGLDAEVIYSFPRIG